VTIRCCCGAASACLSCHPRELIGRLTTSGGSDGTFFHRVVSDRLDRVVGWMIGPTDLSLREVFRHPSFEITGVPVFFVAPRSSKFFIDFFKEHVGRMSTMLLDHGTDDGGGR
jgi:hypothetical protein